MLRTAVERVLAGADTPQVQPHVVHGHPARALLDAASDAELLVVGSRGHGGFTGMLLGSVSHHLIAHAPCPVLAVHSTGRPAQRPPTGRDPAGLPACGGQPGR